MPLPSRSHLVLLAAALAMPCCAHAPAATASAAATAAPAALHVSPEKVLAPARPAVLRGYNISNGMLVADFADDLRALAPAQLRFPGGNVGDEVDLAEYPLNIFQANLSILQGDGAPIPTLLQTRVFQGTGINREPPRNTPEDAAQAVRWARARGIVVPYWEIGNEPDLFSVTRADPSWTPERYCEVFRAQARAIKAVDPQARVAGPAVSGSVPAREPFVARFVELCGDAIDVFTWHVYPTDGTKSDDAALDGIAQIDDSIAGYKALLADPQRNPRGHQHPAALGVTEYGLSWFTNRGRHLADVPAALWAAEAALRMNEQGVEVAHYFALAQMTNHGLIDQTGVRRPTYYAFRMLRGLSGQLVAASAGDPALWTHAAVDGDRLDVVVINRSGAPRAVATALPGWTLTGGEWFDAAVVDAEGPATQLKPAPAAALPARAMLHLAYRKAKG